MVGMIISFFVAFLSFNFFMNSYQINGMNRLVLGMPVSLYETAINMIDIDEEKGPFFNKNELEDNLTSFYAFHMPRYTDDYRLSFYYYNPNNHSLYLGDEPRAVEVTIRASLVLFNNYRRTMFYEIRSN